MRSLYYVEMIGIAVFAISGVRAVTRRGLDMFGALVLGIVTALGRGALCDRGGEQGADTRASRPGRGGHGDHDRHRRRSHPRRARRATDVIDVARIYATPILAGCMLFVMLRKYAPQFGWPDLAGIVVILGIRAIAIHRHLQMPRWLTALGGEERRL